MKAKRDKIDEHLIELHKKHGPKFLKTLLAAFEAAYQDQEARKAKSNSK